MGSAYAHSDYNVLIDISYVTAYYCNLNADQTAHGALIKKKNLFEDSRTLWLLRSSFVLHFNCVFCLSNMFWGDEAQLGDSL